LSPAISSEQELHGVGLRYDDLPLYDNTLDLLILLRAHATTLDESRKLATKLQAKNDEFELTRKELAHALEKEQISTRFRNRVLGMLSHEFRTSLAQILSVAELLRRGIKLDQAETVRKHGETLSNAVTQIMEAFDSLSHYARSEGSWEQEREAIDVAELIHEAIRRVRTPESEGIRVVGPAAGSPGPRMESSRSLLLIALTNLLSNAIKYSKAGGEVRVGCAECEGEIAISVEDQGIGIPASLQPEIFETYVRGTNVGNVPGTGLGLAVVTLCVDALGGKVHLRSTQDVGTRATITLPVTRP
jgi:signal transduction histidine kinase